MIEVRPEVTYGNVPKWLSRYAAEREVYDTKKQVHFTDFNIQAEQLTEPDGFVQWANSGKGRVGAPYEIVHGWIISQKVPVQSARDVENVGRHMSKLVAAFRVKHAQEQTGAQAKLEGELERGEPEHEF